MANKVVNFAVVGCGRISAAHLDAIKNAPNARLAAVCDIVEEKARNAALKHGLSRWYCNLDEMLDKENIDVVNICTPSGVHCENAVAAARKGKHVLCEKPLDVSREKLDLMIRTCEENHVLLGGIFQRRTSLAAINTRKAIQEGRLGKIVMASAYLKYCRTQEYYDSDAWRGTWRLDGGGALMNQGIHGIDLLQWMVGDIEKVFARCATLVRRIETEDTAVVSLKFKNEAIGVIEGATSVYPGQDTVFSIHGEKGTITFGDRGFYEWKTIDPNETPPESGDGLGGLNCGWNATNSGHTKQVQDMADAVICCKQPMVPGSEARKAVDLVLAIYESARRGKEISI